MSKDEILEQINIRLNEIQSDCECNPYKLGLTPEENALAVDAQLWVIKEIKAYMSEI